MTVQFPATFTLTTEDGRSALYSLVPELVDTAPAPSAETETVSQKRVPFIPRRRTREDYDAFYSKVIAGFEGFGKNIQITNHRWNPAYDRDQFVDAASEALTNLGEALRYRAAKDGFKIKRHIVVTPSAVRLDVEVTGLVTAS